MTLGEMISKFRKENSLSVKEFAAISGLSVPMVYKLEAWKLEDGLMPNPNAQTLNRLSQAMHVPVDELKAHVGEVGPRKNSDRNRQKQYEKNYENSHIGVKLWMPKDTHEKLVKSAEKLGVSKNSLIISLIDRELENIDQADKNAITIEKD